MKFGFTGTQRGMTPFQRQEVAEFLDHHRPEIAIHGGCIGADEDFHRLCQERKIPIRVHLPNNLSKTSKYVLADEKAVLVSRGRDYLQRNQDIVDEASGLIATPKEQNEVLRSGTWATIRRAKKAGKIVMIVPPSV